MVTGKNSYISTFKNLLLYLCFSLYFSVLVNTDTVFLFYAETAFILCLLVIMALNLDSMDGTDAMVMVLMLLTLPSMENAPDKYKNFISIKNLAFSFSCLVFFRHFCKSPGKRTQFLYFFSFYALFLSLKLNVIFLDRALEFGLNYAIRTNEYAIFHHINFLGTLFNLAIFIIGILLTGQNTFSKSLCLVLSGLSISVSILLTLSKIGVFLLMLNILFILRNCFKLKFKALFMFMLVLLVLMSLHPEIRGRFLQLVFGKYYMDRVTLFAEGVNVFLIAPYTGIGGLNFGYYNRMMKKNNIFLKIIRNGTYSHCHNTFLELLLSYGIFFFSFLLIFLYFIFSKGFSDPDQRYSLLFLVTLLFLNGIVDDYLWMSKGYILFGLVASFCPRKFATAASSSISSLFRIALMLLFITGYSILIWYNHANMLLNRNLDQVNRMESIEQKIKLLENSTRILPFASDTYTYLSIFNILSGDVANGFRYLNRGIKYSRLDLEMSLLRIWQYAFNDWNYEDCIRMCQTLTPDEDGVSELTYALVHYFKGNLDRSTFHMSRYLVKFPLFINDVFFSLNPGLHQKVLDLLSSKEFQDNLISTTGMEDYISLRISRIFYNAGRFQQSLDFFQKVDRSRLLALPPEDEIDVYVKNEFITEYELMKFRFTRSVTAIPWKEIQSRDVIFNDIIQMYHVEGDHANAVRVTEDLIRWRRVDSFSVLLREKFPSGVFYGIKSALTQGERAKALKFCRFLLREPPGRFLGYLGLALCSSGNEKSGYLASAWNDLTSKKHLFITHNSLLMFVYFKPDTSLTQGIPTGVFNHLEFLPDFILQSIKILVN